MNKKSFTMITRSAIIFCILACLLPCQAFSKTYKIGNLPWSGYAIADVAEAKGFFKAAGVDVKTISFESNQAMENALQKKLLDIRYDMIGTMVGLIMDGEPYVIIAETDWSNGGDKLIVKPDVNLAAMKGKPVGVYLNGPAVNFFLNKYLTTLGLKTSDFKIIEMESAPLSDKFISGLFSAIINYDPDALKAEREGNGKLVATSATYPGCIPEGLFMRKDTLQSMPRQDLINILKGYAEAVKWAKDPANEEELLTILGNTTFKGMGLSKADLKDGVDTVLWHDASGLVQRNAPNGGLEGYLTELHGFLKSNGMLKKDYSPADVFDNTYILEALK